MTKEEREAAKALLVLGLRHPKVFKHLLSLVLERELSEEEYDGFAEEYNNEIIASKKEVPWWKWRRI